VLAPVMDAVETLGRIQVSRSLDVQEGEVFHAMKIRRIETTGRQCHHHSAALMAGAITYHFFEEAQAISELMSSKGRAIPVNTKLELKEEDCWPAAEAMDRVFRHKFGVMGN